MQRVLSSTPRAAYQRSWRAENPERGREYNRRARVKNAAYYTAYNKAYAPKARDRHLQKKYGVTLVEWNALFEAQGRCCDICKSVDPGQQNWHTDHSGPLPCTSENIRGILCCFCNHALKGGTRADVERLRASADYLEKHL